MRKTKVQLAQYRADNQAQADAAIRIIGYQLDREWREGKKISIWDEKIERMADIDMNDEIARLISQSFANDGWTVECKKFWIFGRRFVFS